MMFVPQFAISQTSVQPIKHRLKLTYNKYNKNNNNNNKKLQLETKCRTNKMLCNTMPNKEQALDVERQTERPTL
jgi:hypothetical protein